MGVAYSKLRVDGLVVHIVGNIGDLGIVALALRRRRSSSVGRLKGGHGGESVAVEGGRNGRAGELRAAAT